jgi:excisionase family DNA binding protein
MTESSTPASRLLTVAEAAKLSPLSEPQVRDRIRDGRLACIRLGRHIYVDADVLEQHIAAGSSK